MTRYLSAYRKVAQVRTQSNIYMGMLHLCYRARSDFLSAAHLLPVLLGVLLPLRPAQNCQASENSDSGRASVLAGEEVDIDFANQKYWELNSSDASSVLLNRKFSRKDRFELGLQAGSTSSDPFLNILEWGLKVSYGFSDEWQVEAMGWKYIATGSKALSALQDAGTTANTNPPTMFVGGGVTYNPIYGKLSLLGTGVIRYDLYIGLGMGVTWTESGQNFTGYASLGQLFYVSNDIGISLDYKMMVYPEAIYEKADASRRGKLKDTQINRGDSFVVGISFFL